MSLAEPVTALTDYALAVTSLAFAVSLARSIDPHNRVSAWLWCAAFIALAISAAAGGTFHGGALALNRGTRETLWNVVMCAAGASGAFIGAGVHAAHIRRTDETLKWLVSGIAVALTGLAVQQTGFSSGASFNHNDAFHLMMIAAAYLFYRCARTVRDRSAVAAS